MPGDFEECFRKVPLSWRISLIVEIKLPFANFHKGSMEAAICILEKVSCRWNTLKRGTVFEGWGKNREFRLREACIGMVGIIGDYKMREYTELRGTRKFVMTGFALMVIETGRWVKYIVLLGVGESEWHTVQNPSTFVDQLTLNIVATCCRRTSGNLLNGIEPSFIFVQQLSTCWTPYFKWTFNITWYAVQQLLNSSCNIFFGIRAKRTWE